MGTSKSSLETDILIIGTGVAGLSAALKLADHFKITLLAKSKLEKTNSSMAQGGIASVSQATDNFNIHVEDTLKAGAKLNNPEVVREVVQSAPQLISELAQIGVQFDRLDDGQLSLNKEGCHSKRRILHVGDYTGKNVQQALFAKASQHPNITFFEDHLAIDLITKKQVDPNFFDQNYCLGAYVLNAKTQKVLTIKSLATILASGGAGKVYLYTSNWSGATGDGIAMAYRAGARVKDLEFMQFHPTCLFHPKSRNFLISEALRGEGGVLKNRKGESFMDKYHPLGSLAPRDIVARSIDAEMKKTGDDYVVLDITHHTSEFLKNRFPQIFQKCLELGIDISKEPIPVVPAAHYTCGGVMTDINGRTDIKNLYAIGETACTGLHGANRLASNSLLECIFFANSCFKDLVERKSQFHEDSTKIPAWVHPKAANPDELAVVSHMWDEIRRLMWNYVGIVRTNRRLMRAFHRIKNIQFEIREYYSGCRINSDIIELRNIAVVAELTVSQALKRKQSVGIHFNLDYPPIVAAKKHKKKSDSPLQNSSAQS